MNEAGPLEEYAVDRAVVSRIGWSWNMWKDNADLIADETRALRPLR